MAGDDDELLKAWGRIAGLPSGTVRHLFPVLLENRICRPDGSVDEPATQFVRKRIADSLK